MVTMPEPIKNELSQVMAAMRARIDSTDKIARVTRRPKPRCKHPHINLAHRYRTAAQLARKATKPNGAPV